MTSPIWRTEVARGLPLGYSYWGGIESRGDRRFIEVEVKPWDEIFWMTSDLGLARNISGLGLAAGFNHIYPNHVTAVITKRADQPEILLAELQKIC